MEAVTSKTPWCINLSNQNIESRSRNLELHAFQGVFLYKIANYVFAPSYGDGCDYINKTASIGEHIYGGFGGTKENLSRSRC